MRGQTFLDRLKQQFGDKITGSNLEAIDPWIEVSPEGLVEVCTYLRDEPICGSTCCELITAVDYFEPDREKGGQSHLAAAFGIGLSPVERAESREPGAESDAAALEERRAPASCRRCPR